jgi:hypothetical protein
MAINPTLPDQFQTIHVFEVQIQFKMLMIEKCWKTDLRWGRDANFADEGFSARKNILPILETHRSFASWNFNRITSQQFSIAGMCGASKLDASPRIHSRPTFCSDQAVFPCRPARGTVHNAELAPPGKPLVCPKQNALTLKTHRCIHAFAVLMCRQTEKTYLNEKGNVDQRITAGRMPDCCGRKWKAGGTLY